MWQLVTQMITCRPCEHFCVNQNMHLQEILKNALLRIQRTSTAHTVCIRLSHKLVIVLAAHLLECSGENTQFLYNLQGKRSTDQ